MFMAQANAGYYATHDPFADFTTAPEISQVFGELLGAWMVVVWQGIGEPEPVRLAECGPGRGTLMADMLRAIGQAAPRLRAALQLHLVETSPRLRAVQAAVHPQAVFHDTVEDLPPGPLLLIANEFLDALPIRQFVRRGLGWTERFVQHGRFVEQPAQNQKLTLTGHEDLPECVPESAPEGAIVELCEPARHFAAWLGARLARQGGAALILDYGPDRSGAGCSLQALRGGQPADPLRNPGQADLTAHVDFQAVAHAARQAGARVEGPIPQGRFLTSLGLFPRTHQLARGQPPAQGLALIQAASRLAEPHRMGQLFKAMAICQPAAPQPIAPQPAAPILPGFEP
jgi:NADH dehydrogenase [ubiquinone] 1 alpha subcomplex assembly factor 7